MFQYLDVKTSALECQRRETLTRNGARLERIMQIYARNILPGTSHRLYEHCCSIRREKTSFLPGECEGNVRFIIKGIRYRGENGVEEAFKVHYAVLIIATKPSLRRS